MPDLLPGTREGKVKSTSVALKKVKVFPGSRKVPSKFTSWDYSLLIVSTVIVLFFSIAES